MKLGAVVICYTIIAVIVHVLFILYSFSQRPVDCISTQHTVSGLKVSFEMFIIWTIVYFPFLLFCALYILLFRMSRSFICSCWQCCGNDVNGKAATKCKICFEGVFGNPLIFAIIFILWGIWEFAAFDSTCAVQLHYGFLADVVIVSISLLLLCIYYFVRVKRRFEEKRNERIAHKYNEQQHENQQNQIHEYHEGDDEPDIGRVHHLDNIEMAEGGADARLGVAVRAPPGRRYSAQPMQPGRNALVPRPQYAASAQEVDAARRHSFNAQPLHQSGHRHQESVSISVDLESPSPNAAHDDEDIIPAATRTRGPSISFPSQFKGHARKVSSRILNILQRIEPEPECSICMCELEKGDEMGQLECGHAFHKECIVEWLGNDASCPMCRVDMKR